MKKKVENNGRTKSILLIFLSVIIILFLILPLLFSIFDGAKLGNVALIPLEGIVTTNGASTLSSDSISSETIVRFIEEAEKNSQIKAIVIQINSPGGTPVATDEVATAIQKAQKPVITLIREIGASGGYWIASSTDYIIANKMSMTGSIGVISSYLEFSGLMEKYGVGYERLVAGENKDMGIPYKQLTTKQKALLQTQLDKMHSYFISEVAKNRNLPEEEVRKLATGEVYLGSEALDLGLIDQLGNIDTVKQHLTEKYGLEEINFVVYQQESSLIDLLTGLTSQFSFKIGEGLGASLQQKDNTVLI